MAEFTKVPVRTNPKEKATVHHDELTALGPVAHADIDRTHCRPDVICPAESVAG